MTNILPGIEKMAADRSALIRGRRIGLVAHPASVTSGLRHTLDVLLELGGRVELLFGPEHGFAGEAQDMEPVDGAVHGPHGLPLHSLYGADEQTLAPRPELVEGLDALVVDLADVGSRYYTFVWTALLCLRVCRQAGVELVILDRPNPLGGDLVEGAPQRPGFLSFVGLAPVANRHGMTVAELLGMCADDEGLGDALTVVPMAGWRREMRFADTGLPWVLPSPNMPTTDTALVYPGGCLIEATWASEGRGTTRPFELVGAPEIDGVALARRLAALELPGVIWRPMSFVPGFQKHAGASCGGVQMHVTDAAAFQPYRTGVALLLALKQEAGAGFRWRAAPYEFVADRPAIDLLTGSAAVREGIEAGATLDEIGATWAAGEREFREQRQAYLLYR